MKDYVPAYDKRPELGLVIRGYVDAVGRATWLDQGAVEVGEPQPDDRVLPTHRADPLGVAAS